LELIGVRRAVEIVGAATVTALNVRPDKGIEWVVLNGGVIHDDVARNMTWSIVDEDKGLEIVTCYCNAFLPAHVLGIGENYFYNGSSIWSSTCTYPLILTNNLYAKITASAMAAGKHMEVGLHVIERPENFDLALMEMFANYMGYKLPIASRE